LSIFGDRKGIPVLSANRLQRWAATLLRYDFRIEYRRSTDFGQADAICRLISAHSAPDELIVVTALQAEFGMGLLTSYLPATFNKLRLNTENDALQQRVKKSGKSRWTDLKTPRQHADWSQLEGFYRRRESLTIEQVRVVFRVRAVIPTTPQAKVLKLFHQGHPGIQRMKSLARNYAYWPVMDHDIQEMVRGCGPFAAAAK
jgi:hypothetical protein